MSIGSNNTRPVACNQRPGGHIPRNQSARSNHGPLTNAHELMNGSPRTDHCHRPNVYMTTYLSTVAESHFIAKGAVVSDVSVGHHEDIITHIGNTLIRGRTPVQRRCLAYLHAIPEAQRAVAPALTVLGRAADKGACMCPEIFSDPQGALQNSASSYLRALT